MTDAPPRLRWQPICAASALTPNRGAAARVGGEQVAVFLLGSGELLAIDDVDPFSAAAVLSRGLVGELAGEPTLASPVYKQRFELRTGRCVDDPDESVRTWPARLHDGWVEVAEP